MKTRLRSKKDLSCEENITDVLNKEEILFEMRQIKNDFKNEIVKENELLSSMLKTSMKTLLEEQSEKKKQEKEHKNKQEKEEEKTKQELNHSLNQAFYNDFKQNQSNLATQYTEITNSLEKNSDLVTELSKTIQTIQDQNKRLEHQVNELFLQNKLLSEEIQNIKKENHDDNNMMKDLILESKIILMEFILETKKEKEETTKQPSLSSFQQLNAIRCDSVNEMFQQDKEFAMFEKEIGILLNNGSRRTSISISNNNEENEQNTRKRKRTESIIDFDPDLTDDEENVCLNDILSLQSSKKK